jgi:peroxiredoxin
LRKDLQKFEQLDGFLFPILADNEKNAKKMEEKYARNYAIFYDESKTVPKLLNQQIKIWKGGRMPGLLIIDKQGIIQYAYYSDSMKDIPKNEILLQELEKINN